MRVPKDREQLTGHLRALPAFTLLLLINITHTHIHTHAVSETNATAADLWLVQQDNTKDTRIHTVLIGSVVGQGNLYVCVCISPSLELCVCVCVCGYPENGISLHARFNFAAFGVALLASSSSSFPFPACGAVAILLVAVAFACTCLIRQSVKFGEFACIALGCLPCVAWPKIGQGQRGLHGARTTGQNCVVG